MGQTAEADWHRRYSTVGCADGIEDIESNHGSHNADRVPDKHGQVLISLMAKGVNRPQRGVNRSQEGTESCFGLTTGTAEAPVDYALGQSCRKRIGETARRKLARRTRCSRGVLP